MTTAEARDLKPGALVYMSASLRRKHPRWKVTVGRLSAVTPDGHVCVLRGNRYGYWSPDAWEREP